MNRRHAAAPQPPCIASPPCPAPPGARSVAASFPGGSGWWSACVLLPLWMGWVFGSLGVLGGREVADAWSEAESLAADIRYRLGPDAFAQGPLLVAIDGHRCGCASDADAARWSEAVRMTGGVDRVVAAPGAGFSTLVFDIHGALRFAGSPAAAGCTRDPARLLAAAQLPSTVPTAPFVSACVC